MGIKSKLAISDKISQHLFVCNLGKNKENFIKIDGICLFNASHELESYDSHRNLVYCKRCDIIFENIDNSFYTKFKFIRNKKIVEELKK